MDEDKSATSRPIPDFPTFSVQDLISQGNLLLASSGKEFIKPIGILATTAEVKKARKEAMGRLGLDFLDDVADDMELEKELAADMDIDSTEVSNVGSVTRGNSPMDLCPEAGGTKAEVTALPGDAVRVKMRLARPWTFEPGQHAYVYFPRVGWWTSHPFSVAWSDEDEYDMMSETSDSLPKVKQDVLEAKHKNIYFVIRRRTGFTEKLWRKAVNSPNGTFTTTAFAEGPYNSQDLRSYGTVLLFAAGIGITHSVPHVRELVRGYSNGTCAARKITLVWMIQSPEHLEWIREWMTVILGLPRRREVLKILLFVSRPKNTKEIYSPSSSVQMFPGRPNVQAIVDQEVATSIGAIGVSVCGVGAVADDVRYACRQWEGKVNIDFEEESFSW